MPATIYTDEDLRLWRAKEKLSQTEAGVLLGAAQTAVSSWEGGAYPRDLKERMERADQMLAIRRGEPTKSGPKAGTREDRADQRRASRAIAKARLDWMLALSAWRRANPHCWQRGGWTLVQYNAELSAWADRLFGPEPSDRMPTLEELRAVGKEVEDRKRTSTAGVETEEQIEARFQKHIAEEMAATRAREEREAQTAFFAAMTPDELARHVGLPTSAETRKMIFGEGK